MAEQNRNTFNDQPVLIDSPGLAGTTRNLIIGAAILVIAAAAAIFLWQQRQQAEDRAADAFEQAADAGQWQQVIDRYPRTRAADAAMLALAADRLTKDDFQAAADWYARYLRANGKSPLAPAAQFAQAQALAAAGQTAEAQGVYQTIVSAKPTSPYAGGAAVALAKIYLANRNVSAARQTLTDFLTNNLVNSSYQAEASRLLRELPPDGAQK
jgi:outer membrane protein assembly factor BamD (BamD/ComL family)